MIKNYPESIIERNKYLEKRVELLEKSIAIHKEEIEDLENYNHELGWDLNILAAYQKPDEVSGNTPWFWQNDGYDNLSSMNNKQAILISAENLKLLLKDGEKVYDI